MSPRVDHHVALRVSEMGAAIRFWTDALDARIATAPVLRGGSYLDAIIEAIPVTAPERYTPA